MAGLTPFSSSTVFCAMCGSILPLLEEFGSIKCYTCTSGHKPDIYNKLKFSYTIPFNTISMVSKDELSTNVPEGPIVERKCPKCGNDKMSYATLQLRSADEGQTVFYTCVSCKYKETENS